MSVFRTRITSYNVCYTKLLRFEMGSLRQIGELFGKSSRLDEVVTRGVITSYSIHYTKLYDVHLDEVELVVLVQEFKCLV